jgi:hypothetical protein
VNGRFVPQTTLTDRQRAEMLALLQAHFTGLTESQFNRDLAEKNWVILLEDAEGRLRGFSTLLCYTSWFGGEPLQVVYSGDTIVDRSSWGSTALARTWIGAIHALRERIGAASRWYWLLITSGFRTYRFLPVFWREFWPRWDAATPPGTQALLDALARERFRAAFDASTGVVRFAVPQVLREELRDLPAGRLQDSHVAFFNQRNPGSGRGDELACLCELSDANLTAAGRRMLTPAQNPTDAARRAVA